MKPQHPAPDRRGAGGGSARPYGRARIETRPSAASTTRRRRSSARPYGRARIETRSRDHPRVRPRFVAPGLTAGRGLKRLVEQPQHGVIVHVAPGLTAGRGLKLPAVFRLAEEQVSRSARPYGRARIETNSRARHPAREHDRGSARPYGRARIETRASRHANTSGSSGSARPYGRARIETSGAPRRGCGCRRCSARPYGRARIETSRSARAAAARARVAPGLTAGRGLKRCASRTAR